MLGVVLQGEACAIFLREGTPVRSRKYKRTLVMKNTYHRERTNVPFTSVHWYHRERTSFLSREELIILHFGKQKAGISLHE